MDPNRLPDPPAVIYVDDDEDDNEDDFVDDDDDDDFDWYDRLSAEQQREVDEREAFNDKLDMFRREY